MLPLKEVARLALDSNELIQDYRVFEKEDFDPNELQQLKEMNERELPGLMIYCGIRVYEGVPLCVMEEDEMRMAYVIWRADIVKKKKERLKKLGKRGLEWNEYLQKIMRMVDSF